MNELRNLINETLQSIVPLVNNWLIILIMDSFKTNLNNIDSDESLSE